MKKTTRILYILIIVIGVLYLASTLFKDNTVKAPDRNDQSVETQESLQEGDETFQNDNEASQEGDEITLESNETSLEVDETNEDDNEEDQTQESSKLDRDGHYYSKDDVALYLHTYGELPSNYLTKSEANDLGWEAREGNLWDVTDKGVIGGDRFGNREGLLPKGEQYFEADVNYNGGYRDAERLVYTREGKVIYYTGDHYESFEVLYE